MPTLNDQRESICKSWSCKSSCLFGFPCVFSASQQACRSSPRMKAQTAARQTHLQSTSREKVSLSVFIRLTERAQMRSFISSTAMAAAMSAADCPADGEGGGGTGQPVGVSMSPAKHGAAAARTSTVSSTTDRTRFFMVETLHLHSG